MNPLIAYFSMEIALDPAMPTYSGGLGMLAGDTIRSAADLDLPLVAVTLLHRKGYFRQRFDQDGRQSETPDDWPVAQFLEELPERVTVTIEGRTVTVRAWRLVVRGSIGRVPVYLLDTDLPENAAADRTLTHFLYGGDARYRLCQEAVLGIGGVRMLRALGHDGLRRFHMNEGHSALLALELLDEVAHREGRQAFTREDIAKVRRMCVFTTHTPVASGHDRFPGELVASVLGRAELLETSEVLTADGELNMSLLALNLSQYVNGVAKRHGETARLMFREWRIHAITNGVHAVTWAAPAFKNLFDRWIPGWRDDSFSLRYAQGIAAPEIWAAHQQCKQELLARIARQKDAGMDAESFTIGFARRATPYKRASLLFEDLERLRSLARPRGLQIVYAGKAHPRDAGGKQMIQDVFEAMRRLEGDVRCVYLENYDFDLARLLVAGVDLWLNTPEPPLEASGTSGMKAAINGVPSLSVLDGWWLEGHIEGVTGWAIGEHADARGASQPEQDARLLYDELENVVLPMFWQDRGRYTEVMRHAIALNGSFFNTQRMLQEYVVHAYF